MANTIGHLFRYLDTNGDGTGTKNATGNHASAAEHYKITVPANGAYVLERMIVSIQDVGAPDAGSYGNSITLTNGISIKVFDSDDSELLDLTDGVPIKTNLMWNQLCYDAKVSDYGTGDNSVEVRWTFSKSGSAIYLTAGQYLAAVLNDDFTGLTGHYFMVQGTSTFTGSTARVGG